MKDRFKDIIKKVEKKWSRDTFAYICFAVLLVISLLSGITIFGSLRAGLAIWCVLMALSVDSFLISVPEITGLLAVNLVTGDLTPYGTGLHFRYPWEQVKEGNFINLRQITEVIPESYPSKDSLMQVKWQFQYTPLVEGLELYISADDNTIKTGLRGLGSSVVSREIAKRSGDDCKVEQEDIEKEMLKKFLEAEPTPLKLYGIRMDRVSLADIDFDPSVQQARSSQEVAIRVQKIADALKKDHPDISGKDALNAALIINKNITKNVFEIEGIGPALAALIDALRGGKK